jgi:endoglucanase
MIRKFVVSFALMIAGCGASTLELEDGRVETTQQPLAGVLAYRGVNLCGAEFGADAWGNGALPGTFGSHYTYPDPAYASGYNSADYFIGKGMTTFRLPFRWERLQPKRSSALDAAELGRLKATVNRLLGKGAAVILNPQNFARYGTALIGSAQVPNSQFADFWSRLANEFKGNPNVIFGLVNEPHDIGTEQWASAANAAIAAIRATGSTNLVLVPGNGWTGAHSWTSSHYGTPNSVALLDIVDPKDNYAFEVHQYLDADASGGGAACVSSTIGSERMTAFTQWLRANGKRGFLGELGGSNSPTCLAAIDDILKHVEESADVYLGWTYWAGGPWWGSYMLSLEPTGSGDTAQMKTIAPHLSWTAPVEAPACSPSTYEAESMDHSTGGATAGGWNIWSNGSIAKSHGFRTGRTSITVTAAGQRAGGVWPRMTVSVGDVVVGTVNVTSTAYAPYAFAFDAPAGSATVRVTFDNDGSSGSEDRNLLVDKVVVGCPPTCTSKTYEAESMAHSTGGATNGGWNLWSNGDVSTNATLPAGTSTITVSAAGTVAAGVWPRFVVSIDGQTIGSASATTTGYRDYPFTFTGSGGAKQLRITFDNDQNANGEDRNLLLDKVVVRTCP